MLIVQKGNRQLKIDEAEKSHYLGQGYDLLDDRGDVSEFATNKTVSISEFTKLQAELEALKLEKTLEIAPEKEEPDKKGKSK